MFVCNVVGEKVIWDGMGRDGTGPDEEGEASPTNIIDL